MMEIFINRTSVTEGVVRLLVNESFNFVKNNSRNLREFTSAFHLNHSFRYKQNFVNLDNSAKWNLTNVTKFVSVTLFILFFKINWDINMPSNFRISRNFINKLNCPPKKKISIAILFYLLAIYFRKIIRLIIFRILIFYYVIKSGIN